MPGMKPLLILALVVCVSCVESTRKSVPADNKPAENTTQSKAIETYLSENFGIPGATTSWYGNIKGVSVTGDTVSIMTNLSQDYKKAADICGAVSSYVFAKSNRQLGLNRIQIYGDNKQLLIDRDGLSAACSSL